MPRKHRPTIIKATRADTEIAEWHRQRERPIVQPIRQTEKPPEPAPQPKPGKGTNIRVRPPVDPPGYALVTNEEFDILVDLATEGLQSLQGTSKSSAKGLGE